MSSEQEEEPERLFLTTVEAVELLRSSPRTMERKRVEGTGPKFHKVGPGKRARVVYLKADVLAWIAKYGYDSTSEL